MTRLALTQTANDIASEMGRVEGGYSPGSMQVILDMIDYKPENAPEGLFMVIILDELKIYGHDIWTLYNDVCERKIDKTYEMLRAVQLGHINGKMIKFCITNLINANITDLTSDYIKEN